MNEIVLLTNRLKELSTNLDLVKLKELRGLIKECETKEKTFKKQIEDLIPKEIKEAQNVLAKEQEELRQQRLASSRELNDFQNEYTRLLIEGYTDSLIAQIFLFGSLLPCIQSFYKSDRFKAGIKHKLEQAIKGCSISNYEKLVVAEVDSLHTSAIQYNTDIQSMLNIYEAGKEIVAIINSNCSAGIDKINQSILEHFKQKESRKLKIEQEELKKSKEEALTIEIEDAKDREIIEPDQNDDLETLTIVEQGRGRFVYIGTWEDKDKKVFHTAYREYTDLED